MPIFSKPKSASLNPDKLANKKVYERDRARVASGTPSASSKVDTEAFTSLGGALEEVKNELIRIENLTSVYNNIDLAKLDYGNALNIFSKTSKLLSKILSSSITTTQQIELQQYADSITELYSSIEEKYNENRAELSGYQEQMPRMVNAREGYLQKVISYFDNIITPLKKLITILNSKLVSSGNDANLNVAPELSGINAPNLQGAGFSTSWKLEKGAIQYQNQKYI